jgi:hypothetical protein
VHETSSADYLPISGKTIIRSEFLPFVYLIEILIYGQIFIAFVSADVITIILQIAGAALVGVSESALADDRTTSITPEQANDILLAGLAVQVWLVESHLHLSFTDCRYFDRYSHLPSTSSCWPSFWYV